MSRALGFWSVFALVTASQIGSGVFMLPTTLAAYGLLSLAGWVISGLGAIALALVFGRLCAWFPQTGGPHVYVQHAFGATPAFFVGWTYWVVSWVSTTVVIIASVGYLTPLLGCDSTLCNFVLETGLLFAVTVLNLRGVGTAGRVEFLLTIFKVIPLVIVPVVALYFFNRHNFSLDPSLVHLTASQLLGRVTLLTMWGFIGLETATTAAGSVENPSKTIPRALVAGTAFVALLYLVNSLGIMGVIPGQTLVHSHAPYADAAQAVFGGNWHLLISAIAALICIGNLNAWLLTSGQIILGLAQDKLMPAFLKTKNRYDAPVWGLVISSLGTFAFLLMTVDKGIAAQVLMIIDFSVTAFLFVYFASCLAFFKFLFQKPEQLRTKIFPLLYGAIALVFCGWVIYETPLFTTLVATLFAVAGVPFYLWNRLRKH